MEAVKARETLLAVQDASSSEVVERAFDAVEDAADSLEAGLEAAIELAELEPQRAVEALWRLQGDWKTLAQLEERVADEPMQATMRMGAAIHLARAELSSPAPQLRSRLPELLEWLDGGARAGATD